MQSPLEAIRCETPLTDLLRKARPIGHDSIVTFPNLRQEVYSELAQLDQVTGVKVSLIGTPSSLDQWAGDKNISILHLSCRTSDL